MSDAPVALIVGAGEGVSGHLATRLAKEGYRVMLSARDTGKLGDLVEATGASTFAADASEPERVAALFREIDERFSRIDVAHYNAGFRTKGPVAELDPDDVLKALRVTAFGAFLMAKHAVARMIKQGSGTVLLTGASAGIKGFPQSAPFAMGKFALRGLAESLARELHPQNVHVAHVVIDGAVASERFKATAERPDAYLDPDAIAETFWQLINQHRSAWTHEVVLRPWVETF